jgi:hypothetical protein
VRLLGAWWEVLWGLGWLEEIEQGRWQIRRHRPAVADKLLPSARRRSSSRCRLTSRPKRGPAKETRDRVSERVREVCGARGGAHDFTPIFSNCVKGWPCTMVWSCLFGQATVQRSFLEHSLEQTRARKHVVTYGRDRGQAPPPQKRRRTTQRVAACESNLATTFSSCTRPHITPWPQ